MKPLILSVPVQLPAPERLEELFLEACRAAIAERSVWLKMEEAAAYLRISRRSFDRKRALWGLPVADLDGTKVVLRADLDALVRSQLSAPGAVTVIEFPSNAERGARNAERGGRAA